MGYWSDTGKTEEETENNNRKGLTKLGGGNDFTLSGPYSFQH